MDVVTIGIDPGLSGAVVAIQNGQPIEWIRMPTYQIGSHKRVNCAALASWIGDLMFCREVNAVVEMVGAMPGQGVTSMFSFGHATGSIMGVLEAMDILVFLVTPQKWKKNAGLIGKDKDAARSKAIELWPAWRALDKKIEGQAYADAALIALYGGK